MVEIEDITNEEPQPSVEEAAVLTEDVPKDAEDENPPESATEENTGENDAAAEADGWEKLMGDDLVMKVST